MYNEIVLCIIKIVVMKKVYARIKQQPEISSKHWVKILTISDQNTNYQVNIFILTLVDQKYQYSSLSGKL